jgi:hypothetical protein
MRRASDPEPSRRSARFARSALAPACVAPTPVAPWISRMHSARSRASAVPRCRISGSVSFPFSMSFPTDFPTSPSCPVRSSRSSWIWNATPSRLPYCASADACALEAPEISAPRSHATEISDAVFRSRI